MPTTTQAPDITAAIEALMRGVNADPFSLLGPHLVESGGRRRLVVRTCQPAASSVDLVLDGGTGRAVGMTRRHPLGFFEAAVDESKVVDYRLRVTYGGGHALTIDDPYRYGRILSDYDLHLWSEGRLLRAFERLGAHFVHVGHRQGVQFAVWAPNADRVSVVGDFNGWDGRVHPMRSLIPSGVWELFVPELQAGERYKFEIQPKHGGAPILKADPFGRQFEVPPRSASVTVRSGGYRWRDKEWMSRRAALDGWIHRPMSVYEVHPGSWARVPEEGNRFLTYREMAEHLVPYVRGMGFTHIELLPVMEHPFFGSWGYQVTGFFAPTSRFGPPDDFRYFVDECHRHEIGVILDWVPAHFPRDPHGLARFDGTALYEHADPRQGEHQDWGTLIFNYGRNEVRNFLITNALYWLEEFHVDGLRVDAVASMLYLDYSRREGQWVPNRFGGRENIDAIDFLRELNQITHRDYPGSMMIAEESTAWPSVSRPVYLGGLGFTHKWNMGWMHDILKYISEDPLFRRYYHNHLTFSMLYAFTENFVLPFSHDEVVHGKGSLINKIPGDPWQKRATLRLIYGYLFTHPGKKLLFMGSEFGQWREWNHDSSLDWHLLTDAPHAGVRLCVREGNRLYREERSLHEMDGEPAGFQWIDCNDNENSVIAFIRRAKDPADFTVMVANFTPVPRHGYRIGVPEPGFYRELLNTDAVVFGGGNVGNGGGVASEPVASHGHAQSLSLTLPPLGFLVFKKA